MSFDNFQNLPVSDVLPALKEALAGYSEAVLQAPPGAGKTTLVPLALLNEPWLEGRKIIMLEPRRMAARASAARMAQMLGEALGETVGYSIRLESKTSEKTRIEVITEGILTRRLQADPGLEDVGLVIFDEFHERSLDSDLCLALCIQGREMFREGSPLRLLVMSATLDGDGVAQLLGGAPLVTSQGRQYPVQSYFAGTHKIREPLAPAVVQLVLRALHEQSGSVLVFLPGQREINAVGRDLAKTLADAHADVVLAPLYGSLSMEKQQRAIDPAPPGLRKVVLATNVAETSLTIEGISSVVDSGLLREALFDPGTGMTRLATRRISRASAEQRQGRAGRLGPGQCYRLWSEEQHGRLVAHSGAEIMQADLAPLALQLLAWGVNDPVELDWLDAPPLAAWEQALDVLEKCGALFYSDGARPQLTPHGVRLAQMPLHPRLAHMLLVGCDIHATETASLLAAALSERNPLSGSQVDLAQTVAVLMGEERCPPEAQGWFRRIWQQTRRFARIASEVHKPRRFSISVVPTDVMGVLLASAYPDRIAKRGDSNEPEFQLSNGRRAILQGDDHLARETWLAVAETGGQAGQSSDRIYSATALNPACFDDILSPLVRQEELVEWDNRQERFIAQRRTLCGQIEVRAEPLDIVSEEARSKALLGVVRRKGLQILPWNKSLQQWRDRVRLMNEVCSVEGDYTWPDLSDQGLLDSLEVWLLPYLGQVARLEDFQKLDLKSILNAMLPWPLPLELERLAPERLGVPSGSSIALDYSQRPPVLAVKLQEMFGCEETPTIAGGRVAVQVHLLSPAQRPLQVTQDLAGFWRSSYQDVKKEMKGRYPKHPWPDDPLEANATRHTKQRMEKA